MKFPIVNMDDANRRLDSAEANMELMVQKLDKVIEVLELVLDELRKP